MDIDGMVTLGGALPHWYMPGHAHFVTYRLFDTVPKTQLQELAQRRAARIKSPKSFGLPVKHSKQIAHKLFFREFDEALEANPNRRWLEQTAIAKVIRDNLYHHNGSLFELLAWCVMPNHVHILIQPFNSTVSPDQTADDDDFIRSDEVADNASPLSRIMHSLKSYTANEANKLLGRTGIFWQRESYDHWVRDLDELERIVDYIRLNPVKAGLCKLAHEWVYSSAYDRFCLDGSKCGLVGKLRDDWRR